MDPKGLAHLAGLAALIPADRATAAEWNFTVGAGAALFEKLRAMPVKLGDVASIFVGLQTSADKVYILEEVSPGEPGQVRLRDRNGVEWLMERNGLKPFLNDVTLSTYVRPESRHWLIFPYRLVDDKVVLVPASEMATDFPRLWEYLRHNKQILSAREGGKANTEYWYGYIYKKNLTLFEAPKLIVQVISKDGRYAFDSAGLHFTGGGNGPYHGVRWLTADAPYSLHYLEALLNSPLLDFYLYRVSSPFRGDYWSYGKRFIEQLPIHPVNFTDPADVARHDRMVALVEAMLDLHRKLVAAVTGQEKTVLQRQIVATDRLIDRLVYELYGLREAEVGIVEGLDQGGAK